MFFFRDELKDTITGYKGLVTSVTQDLSGCLRYGLQPPVKEDGTLPDAYTFDDVQLELIAEGKDRREPATEFTYGLRDKVKDTVSNYTGTIVSRTEFLNGCVKYGIQTPREGTEKSTLGFGFETHMVLIEAYQAPADAPPQKKTGGPACKVPGYEKALRL